MKTILLFLVVIGRQQGSGNPPVLNYFNNEILLKLERSQLTTTLKATNARKWRKIEKKEKET